MTERILFKSSPSSSEEEGDEESEIQAKSNDKPKRDRNEDVEASSSSKKRKKGSTVDLEELLARTYPKDVSTAEQNEGGLRRSKRCKKKTAKTFNPAEFVKKWSGEEEIRIAMALLESSSPEGGLNMTEFYRRGKEILNYEMSNYQLYEKMRSMKNRFMLIQSTMEKGNVPEHRIVFRTPQEPALFKIWRQIWGQNISNNNAEQAEAGILNMTVNDAENADRSPNPSATEVGKSDARITGAENVNAGMNGDANPNPGVIEFENLNANPRVREAQNQSSGSSAAENPKILNSIVIEIGNSNPRVGEEIGNPCPTVSQAGNSKFLVNEALNPCSWESGAEKPTNPNPGVIEDPDPRVIRVENPSQRENPDSNGPEAEECNGHTNADNVRGHSIDKGGVTRSRSEIKHSCGFANFQVSSRFGSEIVFEECMGSSVSKRIRELANAANNVEYISHPELHQKYRQHYINQLKLLNEHLELVQEECKLWLNVLEAPKRSQQP